MQSEIAHAQVFYESPLADILTEAKTEEDMETVKILYQNMQDVAKSAQDVAMRVQGTFMHAEKSFFDAALLVHSPDALLYLHRILSQSGVQLLPLDPRSASPPALIPRRHFEEEITALMTGAVHLHTKHVQTCTALKYQQLGVLKSFSDCYTEALKQMHDILGKHKQHEGLLEQIEAVQQQHRALLLEMQEMKADA